MTMTKSKNIESFFALTHIYPTPAFHFFDNADLYWGYCKFKNIFYINLIFKYFDKNPFDFIF